MADTSWDLAREELDNAIRDVLDNLSPETIDIIVSYRFREILHMLTEIYDGEDLKERVNNLQEGVGGKAQLVHEYIVYHLMEFYAYE